MKKILKIGALTLALVLIGVLLWFAMSFLGNPLSYFLADRAADQYLAEHYPDLDVSVTQVSYSFKDGSYHAWVESESSVDTHFGLVADWFGHIIYDYYDSRVLSGGTTAERINTEYREMVDEILDHKDFPCALDFGYGDIQFSDSEYGCVMPRSELELDKLYNVRALGAKYGVLVIYLMDDDVSVEKAAEMVLAIRARFDEIGVPFRVLDLTLRHFPGEEGSRPDGEVYAFLDYDEICEEGMIHRIQASHDAKAAYFAALDAEKEKELKIGQ